MLDGYARDGYPGLLVIVFRLVTLIVVVVSRRAELALLPIAAFLIEGMLESPPRTCRSWALTYAAGGDQHADLRHCDPRRAASWVNP